MVNRLPSALLIGLVAACGGSGDADCDTRCGACQVALTVEVPGAAGADVQVSATPSAGTARDCLAGGDFFQCDVGPGDYVVSVTGPGGAAETREVTIAPDGGGCCACGYIPQRITVPLALPGDAGPRDAATPDAGADAGTSRDAEVPVDAAPDATSDASPDSGGPDASAACDTSAVTLLPGGGALAVGTLCDEVYACADDVAETARIEAASSKFQCTAGAETASGCGAFTCSYRDPGGPSTVDEAELREICRVIALSPTPMMRCVVFL